jgi:hypothetical protein
LLLITSPPTTHKSRRAHFFPFLFQRKPPP